MVSYVRITELDPSCSHHPLSRLHKLKQFVSSRSSIFTLLSGSFRCSSNPHSAHCRHRAASLVLSSAQDTNRRLTRLLEEAKAQLANLSHSLDRNFQEIHQLEARSHMDIRFKVCPSPHQVRLMRLLIRRTVSSISE